MDNRTCSGNIKLLNEELAEEVNAMEMFDLMEINCAMVEKDMITITDLEIKRVLDKKGVKRAISGPLKGPNVQVLKELPPLCLKVSGIRFGNEAAIKMNVREVDLNSIGAGPLHLCSWTTKGADRRCSVLSPFLAKPQICIFI